MAAGRGWCPLAIVTLHSTSLQSNRPGQQPGGMWSRAPHLEGSAAAAAAPAAKQVCSHAH